MLSLTTTYNNLLISCRLSQSSCFPQHQCQQQHQQFLSCIYISQSHINQVDKTGVSLSMRERLRPGICMLFAKFNQVDLYVAPLRIWGNAFPSSRLMPVSRFVYHLILCALWAWFENEIGVTASLKVTVKSKIDMEDLVRLWPSNSYIRAYYRWLSGRKGYILLKLRILHEAFFFV